MGFHVTSKYRRGRRCMQLAALGHVEQQVRQLVSESFHTSNKLSNLCGNMCGNMWPVWKHYYTPNALRQRQRHKTRQFRRIGGLNSGAKRPNVLSNFLCVLPVSQGSFFGVVAVHCMTLCTSGFVDDLMFHTVHPVINCRYRSSVTAASVVG